MFIIFLFIQVLLMIPTTCFLWINQKNIILSKFSLFVLESLFTKTLALVSFLILPENICCGYSLEAPQLGTSNECTYCIVLLFFFCKEIRKNIIWLPLIWSYVNYEIRT